MRQRILNIVLLLCCMVVPSFAMASADLSSEELPNISRAVCPVPCSNGIREICTDISDCLCIIDSKIDNIDMIFTGTVIVDLDATFTVLAEVINEIRSCCDVLMDDFHETWTILGGIETQLVSCCDSLTEDFNETWTILGEINSKLDVIISDTANCDICGTFTAIESVRSDLASCCDSLTVDFEETWTILGGINSKLDILISNTLDCDICDTFTVLNSLRTEIINDFEQTWTILGGVTNQIESCCETLISRIDNIDMVFTGTVIVDLDSTFTVLEAIRGDIASCCDSLTVDFEETWTILGEINSKLDIVISNTLDCDICGTFTVLNEINSKIDSLISTATSGCDATIILITQADVPYTISAPGCYCVAENLDGAGGIIITINSDDVVLDLNCKTLSNATVGVDILTGATDITVKNGYIVDTTTAGIRSVSASDLWFKDVQVTEGHSDDIGFGYVGFYFLSTNKVVIADSSSSNHFGAGSIRGFRIEDSTDFTLINCHADFNGDSDSLPFLVDGYLIFNSDNCTFKCCTANNGNSAVTRGFFLFNSINCRLNYCTASENSGNNAVYGFLTQAGARNDLYQCLANQNTSSIDARGFETVNSTSDVFELCTASGNQTGIFSFSTCVGFNFAGNDGSTTNCKVYHCTAINNISGNSLIGAKGFAFDASTSGCDVRQNTALAQSIAGIGFEDLTAAGSNLLYANFACNNTASNYSFALPGAYPIAHPNSAQEYDNVDCTATSTISTRDLLISCCDSLSIDFQETWTILGEINSKLDVLATNSLACDICGTFTVLDSLQTQVTSDFDQTWTILGEINSKIDALATGTSCDSATILISQSDIPYTISASGCYCVAEDLMGVAGVTTLITINANDVTLDLNCKTLSNGLTGIELPTSTTQNVTIKNGYIVAMTSSGVDVTGVSSNLWLKDVQVAQAAAGTNFIGFNFSNASAVVIQDCSANNNTATTSVIGFSIQGDSFTLINCHADRNSGASNITGYSLAANNCIFKCCTANANQPTNNVVGFSLTSSNNSFDYCIASGNSILGGVDAAGFEITGNASRNRFYKCEANDNRCSTFADGFIYNGGAVSTGNTFEFCVASGNRGDNGLGSGTATGFNFVGAAGSGQNKIHQCAAIANIGGASSRGFAFAPSMAGCDIRENTALAHTSGVGIGFLDTAGTANLIYANFACNNDTNYMIDPSFPVKHPNIAQEYDNVACDATPSSPTTRDLLISCCDSLTVDFQETWTLIGDTLQTSTWDMAFGNAVSIDNADLSVIEWLKTIYRSVRGL